MYHQIFCSGSGREGKEMGWERELGRWWSSAQVGGERWRGSGPAAAQEKDGPAWRWAARGEKGSEGGCKQKRARSKEEKEREEKKNFSRISFKGFEPRSF